MKTLSFILIAFFYINNINCFTQNSFEYNLNLTPVSIPNLPGIHSYAYAQHNGKWLIIGGRIDGIHPRQPFNAFHPLYNNTNIYVIDIVNSKFWSNTVLDLPLNISEQMQSTNMNFCQVEDTLYIIGGYGFSQSSNSHKTFPSLTSIQVSDLIESVINNQPIQKYFKNIQNDIFAVTGGQLKNLNDIFYLVGGHRFDGRYNPMGNPTYSQAYTNQIRKFYINNSNNQLNYENYTTITDPVHLRRRDYNLIPQIFPDNSTGFTISSGVFQINSDLPFLYPVDIIDNNYNPRTSFNQYLSNYHSAVASLYDSLNKNMHTIFFGGISQYYYENGNLIKDDNVPFVKTISRLTRDSNNNLSEFKMPTDMPGFQGTSSEFIPNLKLPHYSSEIIKLNQINEEKFLIGHIFGGINTSDNNPFSNNTTNLTSADNNIYEVWLSTSPLSAKELKINGENPYKINVFPNPFNNNVNITFDLDKLTEISYFITNSIGQIIINSENKLYEKGNQNINIKLTFDNNEKLFLTLIFNNKFFVTKKLVKSSNFDNKK